MRQESHTNISNDYDCRQLVRHELQLNPKHQEFVANQLGLTGAKARPTPGVLSHRATMDATLLLTADDAR